MGLRAHAQAQIDYCRCPVEGESNSTIAFTEVMAERVSVQSVKRSFPIVAVHVFPPINLIAA
jgi:hypothetical protein